MKDTRRRVAVGLLLAALFCHSALAEQAQPREAVVRDDELIRVREQVAQLKQDFTALRQAYDERLLALEQRLSQLGSGPLASLGDAPSEARASADALRQAPPEAPVQTQPSSVVPAGSGKAFNPDISVNGNFLGVGGRNPFSTQPSLELGEAEASFQAIVDPYARADFFLAAGPEGLSVEEGYVTFTSLPSRLLLKVGKMRAQFGKVNTLHTHAMPTANRPLVTENLAGGEEGLSDGGVSLSRLIANPFVFLEATGEVYAGASSVFQSSRRANLNYVGRLRAYKDLTESTNLDLGTSFATGPTDIGIQSAAQVPASGDPDVTKRLFGIDATFRYRPLRRAIYQRFNLRTELIWSRQNLPFDQHTTAFGVYGLGEYQFARRWYVGGRLDRSGRALNGTLTDSGASAFLTFWPSEFTQVRGQYRRTNFAEGVGGNELLFQVNFAIGAHGAHAF